MESLCQHPQKDLPWKKPRVGHPRRRGSLRGYRFFGAGELQSTVIDAGVAEFEQVQSVVLVQSPGAFCALLGKNVHGALDIAGAEINRRLLGDGGVPLARRAI